MRRPVLVGALVTAAVALVASAAVAVGTLDGAPSGPLGTRGDGQGPYGNMMGGQTQGGQWPNSGARMHAQDQGPGPYSGMMGSQGQGPYSGMMGSQGQRSGAGMMGSSMMGSAGFLSLPGNGVPVSGIPAARTRAGTAAKPAGLHPGEVMWFDNGFYVELKDSAGKAATEVLVDPRTGAVGTEPGPAMMWNTRFGMMRANGGGAGTVDATNARGVATSWLAANRPGTTVKSIDAYPGYFTIDLQRNGVVSGMMSVSSSTGAVWYHTWHGAFIAMEDN